MSSQVCICALTCDVCQSKCQLMLPEEERSPSKIQSKLHSVEGKWDSPSSFLPHQPGCHSHHGIKRCPNRSEKPIWRLPRRLLKIFVPSRLAESVAWQGDMSRAIPKGHAYQPFTCFCSPTLMPMPAPKGTAIAAACNVSRSSWASV